MNFLMNLFFSSIFLRLIKIPLYRNLIQRLLALCKTETQTNQDFYFRPNLFDLLSLIYIPYTPHSSNHVNVNGSTFNTYLLRHIAVHVP